MERSSFQAGAGGRGLPVVAGVFFCTLILLGTMIILNLFTPATEPEPSRLRSA